MDLKIKIKPDYLNRIISVRFISNSINKYMYIPSVAGCLAVEDIIDNIVNFDDDFSELWDLFSADITLSNPGYNGDKELYQTAMYVFSYLNEHYTRIIPAYYKSGTDIVSMDADFMTCIFIKLEEKARLTKYNDAIYSISSSRCENKRFPDLLIDKYTKEGRKSVFSKTYTYSYNSSGEYYYVPVSSSGVYDENFTADDIKKLLNAVIESRF